MNDRMDDAIDRAVREMLHVEPPPDQRAKVIARLRADGSRLPAPGFQLPAFGWGFAAAVVILLAVFVAGRSEPVIAPQASAVVRGTDRRLPLEAGPARVPEAATRDQTRTAARSTPSQSRPSHGTVMAATIADEQVNSAAIAPLKTMNPIDVAPITQGSIAPADIALRPLTTITEMQISPLTPPERR